MRQFYRYISSGNYPADGSGCRPGRRLLIPSRSASPTAHTVSPRIPPVVLRRHGFSFWLTVFHAMDLCFCDLWTTRGRWYNIVPGVSYLPKRNALAIRAKSFSVRFTWSTLRALTHTHLTKFDVATRHRPCQDLLSPSTSRGDGWTTSLSSRATCRIKVYLHSKQ